MELQNTAITRAGIAKAFQVSTNEKNMQFEFVRNYQFQMMQEVQKNKYVRFSVRADEFINFLENFDDPVQYSGSGLIRHRSGATLRYRYRANTASYALEMSSDIIIKRQNNTDSQ